MKKIPINIWDDFYDDGYVPEGKKQETHIYVENDDIPAEIQKEALDTLLNYFNTLSFNENVVFRMKFRDGKVESPNLVGTEYEQFLFDRWEIRVENLTHKRLDKLMDELEQANLSVNNIPLYIYSES